MRPSLRQGSLALLLALFAIAIVIGGYSLSTVEGELVPGTIQPLVTDTLILLPTTGLEITTQEPQIITPTGTSTGIPTLSSSPTLPNTLTSIPINTKITIRTATTVPCTIHPNGWVIYYVQPGDNLYRLSIAYSVKVSDLQLANCLKDPDVISVGQKLYVPNVATITPTHTLIYPMSPTATPDETPTPVPSVLP